MTFTIDDIINDLPLDGEMPTTVMADDHGVAVTALRMNVSNFQGVSFNINTTTDGYMNGINTYTFASNFSEATFISLPETLFRDLETNITMTFTEVSSSFVVAFSVFENDNLFLSRPPEDQNSSDTLPAAIIASFVVSAQIPGLNVSDLENPITLAFQMESATVISFCALFLNFFMRFSFCCSIMGHQLVCFMIWKNRHGLIEAVSS